MNSLWLMSPNDASIGNEVNARLDLIQPGNPVLTTAQPPPVRTISCSTLVLIDSFQGTSVLTEYVFGEGDADEAQLSEIRYRFSDFLR